ncbi:MAG: hypothetical protein ACYTFY_08325 [Planctomycetota bacterium]|jgi:hypothetical protein
MPKRVKVKDLAIAIVIVTLVTGLSYHFGIIFLTKDRIMVSGAYHELIRHINASEAVALELQEGAIFRHKARYKYKILSKSKWGPRSLFKSSRSKENPARAYARDYESYTVICNVWLEVSSGAKKVIIEAGMIRSLRLNKWELEHLDMIVTENKPSVNLLNSLWHKFSHINRNWKGKNVESSLGKPKKVTVAMTFFEGRGPGSSVVDIIGDNKKYITWQYQDLLHDYYVFLSADDNVVISTFVGGKGNYY